MESPRRRWRAPRRRPKVRSGQLRLVAAEIQQTAEDLARIRTRDGALSRPTCKAEWEAFRVQDREGKDMLLCAGHAIAAREQMKGATVQPIEPEG
jgi:hypothetical protein